MLHLFLPLCAAAAIAAAPAPTPTVSQDEVLIIIILNKPNTAEPTGHRGLDQLTIGGFADVVNNMVYLSFSAPCGDALVSLENLTTGDSFETVVDGDDGSVAIPVALSPGSWEMSVTVSSDVVYSGAFMI